MAKIKNQSLKKALDILNCFMEKQPLGITEISEQLGLNKSNVFDILSTFAAMDFVEKDEETSKYRLGIAPIKLGRAAANGNDLKELASKHLREIAALTNESAFFTVRQETQIYYMDIAVPLNNTYAGMLSNKLEPMYCTSSGKSMLAFMPESFIEEYLKLPLAKRTEHTITEPNLLRKELEKIRKLGYARDNMEYDIGISCVAVPILNYEGEPLGALSISGPSPRFNDEKVAAYVDILKKHVREMTSKL